MHGVVIKARDGLDLISYITIPKANLRPELTTDKPLPMVLYVHGGPRASDSWGYHPIHQWLASRGFVVLSVNYRASVGFGKDFINAGNGQWGAKMHDDLIDAVNWAIAKNIAEPSKVAIMGGSYGGYATLVGLTFTPDVFACGINIVGVSNLLTFYKSIPSYWLPMLKSLYEMLGANPETEEGREFLASRSPVNYAANITKPLLIGHGANDPRVAKAESDQIVAQMKANKIPGTYVVYPNEGHGFARPENRMSFYAITETFLNKVFASPCQEIGDDVKNSSAQVEEF
jgi:dipeptidyl aminopeptidase/acylaminoacyl peptidase